MKTGNELFYQPINCVLSGLMEIAKILLTILELNVINTIFLPFSFLKPCCKAIDEINEM